MVTIFWSVSTIDHIALEVQADYLGNADVFLAHISFRCEASYHLLYMDIP